MATTLRSATIFFQPGTKRARKYRNISTPYSFESFARESGGYYINWYDQVTGKFLGRRWLQDFRKNP